LIEILISSTILLSLQTQYEAIQVDQKFASESGFPIYWSRTFLQIEGDFSYTGKFPIGKK